MAKVGADDFIVATAATAERVNGLPYVEPRLRLAPEALHGLAGRVVEAIDPYTEADPVATLVTFLVAQGNLIGREITAQAGEDPHPARLYAALAGPTSKGRKGMSWRGVHRVLAAADGGWALGRVASGLSSGEGLIYHVRDARQEQQPIKEKGRVVDYETVTVDAGVADKRLLIEEPELAAVLKRMDREANSLSAVLRQAWDDGTLRTLTKNSPLRATGAHISIIAHITTIELVGNLASTERTNGFANRFLYVLVRRSKELPDPERIPDHVLDPLVGEVRAVVDWVRAQGPTVIRRDPAAAEQWRAIYHDLSAERPGLLGALTARAEAQVLRLSLLYAILDRSVEIRPPHLAAALAVWSYAETSTRVIFGGLLGDPVADQIAQALQLKAELTRTEIRDLLHRHAGDERIGTALRLLESEKLARREKRETGGRPVEVWMRDR